MEDRNSTTGGPPPVETGTRTRYQLIVVLISAIIFLGCIISPPHLMDDVDGVQAQIARNMLESGNWVTARLDGVKYMEKAPLKYWMMAVSYKIFGVHDWAARIPIALCSILLCWLIARFAAWAFGERAGLYAGLSLATCVGLFLFTRILIPDVVLTLAITAAFWSFLRAIDEGESHPTAWAMLLWASMGTGLLLKGLIGVVFPVGGALVYLFFTGQFRQRKIWRRLHLISGTLLMLAIAAPWHVLATIQNPPYFDFTLHSEKGAYHGFFWFYFINEQLLRFLNRRYPHDYNTVPRLYFWLFHLIWLFPWSVYLPALAKLRYRGSDRASRVRLLALCWTGFVLVFFTFSTTQEYYSMPVYPALALLIGSAIVAGGKMIDYGTRVAAGIAAAACAIIAAILYMVRGVPTPGDIASALTSHPSAYTLSLGHMEDLTLQSFAYLRLPLIVAGVAFLIGAVGAWRYKGRAAILSLAVMMVIFFHAARLALVVFDPYMGSYPLAAALEHSPDGRLIMDDQYYAFSSVIFYTDRTALLLNGRKMNLEYGSYSPGAPDVFIDDSDFQQLWKSPQRYYLLAERPQLQRFDRLVGKDALHVVKESGGKYLFCNQ